MKELPDTTELATALTAAWLANPNTRVDTDAVSAFLTSIHTVIMQLSTGPGSNDAPSGALTKTAEEHVRAVTARKSLASPDRIISMIDGKPYRTLRRHLSTHGLTPDEYRARYKLKPEYPMVAPTYSEARREMAKKIGLGRKKAAPAELPENPSEPPHHGRPKLGVSIKI